MFIDNDAIEPHPVGIFKFIKVLVVKFVAFDGIVQFTGHIHTIRSYTFTQNLQADTYMA
jgi:hypothetical protein